jgi:hypothetical protein
MKIIEYLKFYVISLRGKDGLGICRRYRIRWLDYYLFYFYFLSPYSPTYRIDSFSGLVFDFIKYLIGIPF